MTCLVRRTAILSLLLLLLDSHCICQSFQISPLLLTTRSSILPQSASTQSLTSNNRRYSHTHFYADPSSSNIHDQTPPPPSFEQRMRQQLKKHQSDQRTRRISSSPSSASSASSSQTITTGPKTLVPDVRDLNAYKDVLESAGEDNKMLAVLWYSPWCRACKAVIPGIRTLAKRHPDVQFIQVPVIAENANLHQGLDVPSVPYLHLYVPEDPRLVEEKKMTRKRLSGFQRLLCDYERGQCSLEQMTGDDENADRMWSTSNPYPDPSRITTATRITKTNIPETTTQETGVTA